MEFLNGFEQFQKNKYNDLKSDFLQLKDGQSPHTLLVTCSDSRIVPSLIGQYGPGDVFVIRNAGNAIPRYTESINDSVAATVEYAIEVLGIKEVIICGHSSCGAVGAAMGGVPDNLVLINNYLGQLSELKERCSEDGPEAVKENVRLQIENLNSYPFVSNKSNLKIVGLYYDFVNGTAEEVGV